MIKINEIFYSIQGESTLAGCPTVFIRTSGCNLRCTYCDTKYAYYEGEPKSVDEIVTAALAFSPSYVCITGGEPLLQKEAPALMSRFCDLKINVSLETSGSLTCAQVDSRVKKIIDVKTPDSGAPNSFLMENLQFLNVKDEFKFVICSIKDFEWSVEFVKCNNLDKEHTVLFSPSFEKIEPIWLAEKILEKKLNVRLQLQQHKYIWSPTTRGV